MLVRNLFHPQCWSCETIFKFPLCKGETVAYWLTRPTFDDPEYTKLYLYNKEAIETARIVEYQKKLSISWASK